MVACAHVMSGNDDLIKERQSLCQEKCSLILSSIANMRARMTKLVALVEILTRVPRSCGRALVKLYRYTLSPLIGFHCRYLPTCSEYADRALERHGLWAGGWMTLARLLRCHPWGNSGLDYVPDVPPPDARWYLPWRYGRWRGTRPSP